MKLVALIAEDEVVTQKILATALEQIGFQVTLCDDGRECLDNLDVGLKPDLVILDLEMPIMSGIEVLEELNRSGMIESFPIACLTANNQKEIVKKALMLGAHDYIVKPFEVYSVIYRLLDLVFNVEEKDIRNLIENLHMKDPSIFKNPGLQQWKEKGYDAYPTVYENKTVCVLLPHPLSPVNVARLSKPELLARVQIFRKCAFGWRKVWPTNSVIRADRKIS